MELCITKTKNHLDTNCLKVIAKMDIKNPSQLLCADASWFDLAPNILHSVGNCPTITVHPGNW